MECVRNQHRRNSVWCVLRAFAALISILSIGCTAEGVPAIESFGVEEFVQQSDARGSSTDAVPSNLILVGTVSAFRPLTSKNFTKIYENYRDFANLVHPDVPPSMSANQFRQTIGGWTMLKNAGFPISVFEFVFIPADLVSAIQFPTTSSVMVFGEAGDLLAARTNEDGFYIVSEILCEDGPGYFDCASNYDKGIFDGVSGLELNYKTLLPKDPNDKIDPDTYQKK